MDQKTANEMLVPVTKSAALRYILETVEHGYYHYCFNVLAPEKVLRFAAKMESYDVLATRGARAYAKEKGRASARLVLFPLDDARRGQAPGEISEDTQLQTYRPLGLWVYYLLATDGTGVVHEKERLRDARVEPRLPWQRYYPGRGGLQPQYDLVARPVRTRDQRTIYRWTWRMSPFMFGLMAGWVNDGATRVRSSSEKNPAYLLQALDGLRKLPGFKGVREQARHIVLGADIPKMGGLDTHIGGYTDKAQPVFLPGRTLGAMLATAPVAAAAVPTVVKSS